MPTAKLVVDNFVYDVPRGSRRRLLKSFWISVGEDKPLQHTQVLLSDCQNY